MAEPRRREARRKVCLRRPEAQKNGNSSESFARGDGTNVMAIGSNVNYNFGLL
nr:hypothetical protein Iba_chr12fCG3440 [Ipomoea batatas]GME10763.1 hypothetical protein Iba_scaffold10685CG0010 [Ipomoea batatas]